MNGITNEETKKLNQWVVSLAITVVCCALFFLFFAGYFLRTQEKLIEMQVRSEMLEARMNTLENGLMMLGQRVAVPPPPMPVGVAPAPAPAVQAAPPAQPAPAPVPPPAAAKRQSEAAPPSGTMDGGAALLLNTESITPTTAHPAKSAPHHGKAAPKPKPQPEADE